MFPIGLDSGPEVILSDSEISEGKHITDIEAASVVDEGGGGDNSLLEG